MSPSPHYRRVGLHVLPILFCCYLVNYVDRVNVSFAKQHLMAALQLGDAAYGLGSGLFFVGYFFFQVPSNLCLHRIGARKSLALIILLWGLISAAGAFVRSENEFYLQRLLLGASEAGFFPGVILYLTTWFPSSVRGRIFAVFLTAIPVAGLISGPLSGYILENARGGSLQAWQWLFILEGLPCVLLAVWVFLSLADRPADAPWLSTQEQTELEANLNADRSQSAAGKPTASSWQALAQPLVWKLCLLYFCTIMGLYELSFWLPHIIKGLGWSGTLQIGLLSAVPWSFAVLFMLFLGARSDRRQERRYHAAFAAIIATLGFAACGVTHDATMGLIAISLAAAGVMGLITVQWSIPGSLLGGTAAAAGIALVNSFGNLGGFISPIVIGKLTELTQSAAAGLYLTAASLLFAALLLIFNPSLEPKPQR